MDLYYPRPNKSDLVVTLRASILSPLPSQIRFLIKGSTGSFVKYGMDAQDLRQLGKSKGVDRDGYGSEPKETWGTLYEVKEDGKVLGQDPGVRYDVSE